VLRAREAADDELLAQLGDDQEIVRWIDGIAGDYDLEQARAFRRRAETEREAGVAVLLVIADAGTGELLGECELRISQDDPGVGQVGYLLLPHARGRGHATRAVNLLVRFAVEELGATAIKAFAHPDNGPSQRVLERAGFERGELLRDYRGPGEDRFAYVKRQP
jgi:RimJ/RimL family protein N-acetyltransferase